MAGKNKNVSQILSASKIKTFEDCSWTYWAKYHLGLPDEANEGSARGSICHLIFELLMEDRHRKYYDTILKDHSIKNCPAIIRLINKHLNNYNFNTKENYELIDKMIYVGLSNDFFEEGGKLGEPEVGFMIENKRLKYKIRGFIDKHAFYGDTLIITDYKSSKGKFKGDGLHANGQAMMYTLAGRKLKKGIKRIKVRFLFLRFPRAPIQELEFTKDEISGFEHYLSYVNEVVNNFTQEDATSNYAADKAETKWFCAAGKTWVCPLRDPYNFYALYDENDKLLKTSKKDDLVAGDKQKVKKMTYLGCPRHHANDASNVIVDYSEKAEAAKVEVNNKKDPFDFDV